MSGRLVRRLLKQRSETTIEKNIEEEGEPSDEEASVSEKAFNAFGLLQNDEDGDADINGEDSPIEETEPTELALTSNSSVNTTKKKKNKIGKSKSNSEKQEASSMPEKEKSIDELLQELNIKESSLQSTSNDRPAEDQRAGPNFSSRHILAVDSRLLKAEDELRRIFGSRVINSAEKQNKSRNGGRKLLKKKLFLVNPLEHWPRPDNGLTLELTETKKGNQYFKYVLSASYSAIQERYHDCVESHDPNSLVQLLNHHPFHVDTLLALSEVYKAMGEYQTAADLLERCLYALEFAWHPWFNPSLGTCRLPYSIPENRPLFHAVFRHIQHLSRRGCHRTALELSKFLLSLDPSDPLGSLFTVDYHAIRSEQFEWLQAFVDHYAADVAGDVEANATSLGLFPNFAFSLAVAHFRLNDVEEGSQMLEQALTLHPSTLSQLVEKAPVKLDLGWSEILGHRLFASSPAVGPTLDHLVALYVERNSVVWRAGDLQSWLKRVAGNLIATVDKPGGDVELSDWAAVRKEAFPSEKNEYKHLLLADFSDSTATLPPEDLNAIQEAGGPMRGEMFMNGPQGQEGVLAGQPPRDPQGRNPVMVFFEAMLPWNQFLGEEQ